MKIEKENVPYVIFDLEIPRVDFKELIPEERWEIVHRVIYLLFNLGEIFSNPRFAFGLERILDAPSLWPTDIEFLGYKGLITIGPQRRDRGFKFSRDSKVFPLCLMSERVAPAYQRVGDSKLSVLKDELLLVSCEYPFYFVKVCRTFSVVVAACTNPYLHFSLTKVNFSAIKQEEVKRRVMENWWIGPRIIDGLIHRVKYLKGVLGAHIKNCDEVLSTCSTVRSKIR